jgi:hypothetical protein
MSLLSHENQNSAVTPTLWQDEKKLLALEKGVFRQASKKVKDLLQLSPVVKNYGVFSTELLQRPEKKV